MESLQNKHPNFDNTEIAFRNKTNAQLKKAYWLFKVIGNNFLSTIGPLITNFFLNIGLPIKETIRSTIFNQFCGGETIAECENAISRLAKVNVGTILDYSVEGEDKEEVFDETCEEIIRTIIRADGDKRLPITVFKITGIGRFALLEKIQTKEKLTKGEVAEFEKVKARCEKICWAAFDKIEPIMIDAEESWIQEIIDDLALNMMRKYNRERVIIYNTYQMYRADKLADMQADHLIAKAAGFILGAKLVRGAYMEKERARAVSLGISTLIQPNKEATDKDFDAALRYCTDYVEEIAMVCGTHNEDSCRLLTYLLDEKEIQHNHKHVYFSQLLGMSDNLSFNLADADYNVAKYVPYGPITAVMPYLFRRAQENTSVAGQTGRELALIERELKRRKLK